MKVVHNFLRKDVHNKLMKFVMHIQRGCKRECVTSLVYEFMHYDVNKASNYSNRTNTLSFYIVMQEDRSCSVSVSSSPVHIMSSPASRLRCGTRSHPWILQAPTGQQINVTLLDFGMTERHREDKVQANCLLYGYITDKAAVKNVSICGLEYDREKVVYISSSSVIEVILESMDSDGDQSRNVLLGFKGIIIIIIIIINRYLT